MCNLTSATKGIFPIETLPTSRGTYNLRIKGTCTAICIPVCKSRSMREAD